MPITQLPAPPSRLDDPGNFATKADALLGALPRFVREANDLESTVNAKEAATQSALAATAGARDAAAVSAAAAATSAAAAVNAPGTSATSSTELVIGPGRVSLAITPGKAFAAGQYVTLVTDTLDSWLHGPIESHDPATGALVVRVVSWLGAGKSAGWRISPATPMPLQLTGNRITGDFSNAKHSLRTLLQTSAPNGNTNVGVIPNGTGTTARLTLFASADPDNAAFLRTGANQSDNTFFDSAVVGNVPILPMAFLINGVEAMRLSTDRRLLINTGNISMAALQVGAGVAVRDGPLELFQGTALMGALSLTGGAVRLDAYHGNAVQLAIANTPIAAVTNAGVNVTGRIEASGAIVAQQGMTVNGANGLYVQSAIRGAGGLLGPSATIDNSVLAKHFASRQGAIGQQAVMYSMAQANGAAWPTLWNHVVEGDVAYALYSYDNNGGAPFRTLRLAREGHLSVAGELVAAGRFVQAGAGQPGECQLRLHNNARFAYYFLNPDGIMGLWDGTGGFARFVIDTAGNFTAAGNVTAFSDLRLKTELQRLTGALDTVCQLRGWRYKRTDTGQYQIGLVAQEVQALQPELVSQQANGYLALAYGNVTALLVEAIKDLNAKVDALAVTHYH